jgi:hypothetical protein
MCQAAYVTRGHFLPGRHLAFFVLQAPLVLLEKHFSQTHRGNSSNSSTASVAAVQALRQQHSAVQSVVRRLLRSCVTFGVLLALAEVLFWPPLEGCAADVNGIAELSDALAYVAGRLTHGPG